MRKRTDDEILTEAHKYEYLRDFIREKRNYYQLARERKLDLGFLKNVVTKWDEESALAEAAKYEYISEFHKKSKGAYDYLYKRGLLDKCTFKKAVNPYTDNLDNVIYGYFFDEQNSCYIGRTCYMTQRDWEHRNRENDTVYKFSKEHGIEIPQYVILEKGLSLDESSVKEGEWVEKYINDGWNSLNKAKTGSIGGLGRKYPKKTVFEHARQFEYTGDYKKAYPLEYAAAYRRGWTKEMTWLKIKGTERITCNYKKGDSMYNDKEMCIQMLKGRTRKECYSNKKLLPWYRAANEYGWEKEIFGDSKQVSSVDYGHYNDIENVRKAAKPYKTRTEFLKGNSTAYHNALEYEIMDELFPLEKPRHKRGSLTKEKCFEIYASCGYSKTELRKKHFTIYTKMLENGWIEKEQYMTVDEALEIANGCKSKKELSENCRKAYLCLLNANRLDEIVFPEGKKPRSYYTKDVCRNIAIECGGRNALCKKNRYVYDMCKENDWLDEFLPKAA